MEATARAKRIDLYLKSESKTMMGKNHVEKAAGTIWFLIETELAKNERNKKKRWKGNVGHCPLSHFSHNPDTNSVS